jgi:hypothetical protein
LNPADQRLEDARGGLVRIIGSEGTFEVKADPAEAAPAELRDDIVVPLAQACPEGVDVQDVAFRRQQQTSVCGSAHRSLPKQDQPGSSEDAGRAAAWRCPLEVSKKVVAASGKNRTPQRARQF